MDTSRSIKRSNLSKILHSLFILWILFLVIIAFIPATTPLFYDYITTSDVNGVYSLNPTVPRILTEPITGIIMILGTSPLAVLLYYFILYVVGLLSFKSINKFKYNGELEKHPFYLFIKDSLDFLFKMAFIILIGHAILLALIFYTTQGFLGIANYYSRFLQSALVITVIIFALKIIYGLRILWKTKTYPKKDYHPHKIWINNSVFKKLYGVKEELLRFLKVTVLLVIVLLSLITMNLPCQKIEANLAEDEFLFDFHVHTTMSDGFLTPEERVEWYIDQGFAGAAFTDHNNVQGALRARAYVQKKNLDFTVLIGQEFTDDPEGLHLNIFGIEEDVVPLDYSDPAGSNPMNVSDMIPWVKARGGYVIVNHYKSGSSSGGTPFTYEQLRDWGVDGFEIVGQGGLYPEAVRQFCIDNDLIMVAATDEHVNKEVDSFMKITLTDPTNKSIHAIFNALKQNSTQAVLISHYSGAGEGNFFDFGIILHYFLSLGVYQCLSWIGWSLITHGMGMLLLKKLRKLNAK
jgi:predicted metal-dependent phosphoesterase TrpH